MDYTQILQIVSIISVACSSSVVLTMILFTPLRKKLFMRIIAMISLCDTIANIPYTSAYRPSSDNWWCSASSFMSVYFYTVSWMWATVLVLFLNSLAVSKKIPLTELGVHGICWGFPLLLYLLNYIFTNLNYPDLYSFGLCEGNGENVDYEYYHLATFYGLLLSCDVIMLLLYWRIFLLKRSLSGERSALLRLAIEVLWMYPAATTCCWLLLLANYSYALINHKGNVLVDLVADICKILHGAVTAAIFFCNGAESRNRWQQLLKKLTIPILELVGMEKLLVALRPVDSQTSWESCVTAVAEDFSVESNVLLLPPSRALSVDALGLAWLTRTASKSDDNDGDIPNLVGRFLQTSTVSISELPMVVNPLSSMASRTVSTSSINALQARFLENGMGVGVGVSMGSEAMSEEQLLSWRGSNFDKIAIIR